MMIRNAVVEGRFYPSTRHTIFEQIEKIEQAGRYPDINLEPDRMIGAVLPHAGHIYSGYQTIPFFHLLRTCNQQPETYLILHPNHSGLGLPLSIDSADAWSNSVGEVPLDQEFAAAMDLPLDHRAHAKEHSAEVIIPFLQYFQSDRPFSILPICLMDQGLTAATRVAEQIHQAVKQTGREIIVLASCDFSHFLPADEGFRKDQLVMDQILCPRNPEGVEEAVRQNNVSVCGYGPIMALMKFAEAFSGSYEVKVLARGHSGEVTPSKEVVDYISMILYQ